MKRRVALVVLVASVLAACGSKGPPLPPLRLAPAKAEGLSAVWLEGRPMALRFVVPAANDDGSVPADIVSMRIFGVTMPAGQAPPTALDLLGGDLVLATVDVRVPETGSARETTETPQAPDSPPAPGTVMTWEDPTEISATPTPMVRYYAVAGVSSRNRVGIASDVVAVPLAALPPAPEQLSASFTETAIKLDWLGTAEGARYRVYEVSKDGPDVPLNADPVAATTFDVPIAEMGVERCFTVRAARASAGASIESAAAGPVCVAPTDIFPPPAPARLTAVAAEGAVSLIWDAVDAPDLAGYLVLRGDAPGETLLPLDKLQRLFAAPIAETMYKDTTTEAGRRYVYAVVAVDTASPPNRSAESNRVEETGRN